MDIHMGIYRPASIKRENLMKPKSVYVIWPEFGWYGFKVISMWYNDAVSNGKVEIIPRNPRRSIEAKAAALHEAGLITLGTWRN